VIKCFVFGFPHLDISAEFKFFVLWRLRTDDAPHFWPPRNSRIIRAGLSTDRR
jgi:hypothetical protein